MSSPWVNKPAAVTNHNGASAFTPNNIDSNVFNSVSFETPFESSHFQNQQLSQRMQNGGMRNGSPASFNNNNNNNPQYQTNSLVPSKRPREENIGASPQQTPGLLPLSRSQTPQQNPYTGYQPNVPPIQHAPQQVPYSHLQDRQNNATPSPVMANQMRPGGVPQRVSTSSPHSFSPAGQQFHQPSPSQSEQGPNRHNQPHSSGRFTPNPGFPSNYVQTYTPPPGRSSAPPQQHSMSTHHMQQQQPSQLYHPQQQQRQQSPLDQQRLLYQMQLQQQLQQRNLMAQRGNIPSITNPMSHSQMQVPTAQFPGARTSSVFVPNRVATNPESFMKSLVSFMQGKKLPLEMNPIVGNRAVPLASLYYTVAKFGGYKRVMSVNGWETVAAALQFHPMENQAAPQHLKGIYEKNLLLFEEALAINQRQRAQMIQQNPNQHGPQMSPPKQLNHHGVTLQHQLVNFTPPPPQQHLPLGQNPQQQQLPALTPPVKQSQHQQQSPANGFSTPQPSHAQSQPVGIQATPRDSLLRGLETTPPQSRILPVPSPASTTKSAGLALPSSLTEPLADESSWPAKHALPEVFEPKVNVIETVGGDELPLLMRLGQELTRFVPDTPAVGELGTIDVHALTMSLQSGIYSEMRLALDGLVSLSVEPRLQLDLRACDDLVETLIDCAEIQVELLAENAAEVSDVMLVNSYEDVLRGCRSEQEVLQDIPVVGSWEYELDRAVDKLICITTIMRNLSFYETNHPLLADELVIKFLCIIIRYLGTRNMFLRTNANTLDFMKDIIIFLSNLAQQIVLPGREQALCLLHFLLAFAPCPTPNSTNSDTVIFSPYDPATHRYLPPAVDSLAKLLARDEPNRSFYKVIFDSDVTSIPPFDLLTRAFGLAISSVPDDRQDSYRANLPPVVEVRKPFLMQGMLAAGILTNLAPGHEMGVTRSWLTSEDGFSQNLCRFIISLCLEATSNLPHQRQPRLPHGGEDEALFHIILSGITVLRRLVEKSRNPDDPRSTVAFSGVLAKESLLAAMNMVQPRLQGILKQLCVFAGLGS